MCQIECALNQRKLFFEFGMAMPGRSFNSEAYRYGYQGSEMDNEVKGHGNHYTTEFRQLDPRLGRWFSVDPLAAQFPWQSPYMSMDGNPVNLTDVKGLSAEGGGIGIDEPTKNKR